MFHAFLVVPAQAMKGMMVGERELIMALSNS
jgi:hypothetical protein